MVVLHRSEGLPWPILGFLLTTRVQRGFLPLRFFRGLLSCSSGESGDESGESSLRGSGELSPAVSGGEEVRLTDTGELEVPLGRLSLSLFWSLSRYLSRLGLRFVGL